MIYSLMRGRIIISLAVILFLILSLFPLFQDTSNGVGSPVVALAFEPGEDTQYANVEPGEDNAVIFPGTVTARIPAGEEYQDLIISLYGTTGENWSVVIDPPQIQIEPGTTGYFTATISVPPETSAVVVDILSIGGTVRTFPGALVYNIMPIQGTIEINRYFKFSLETSGSTKKSYVGEQVTFDLTVRNHGNGIDNYSLNILNPDEIKNSGISVSPGKNLFEIPERSFEMVLITIRIPDHIYCVGTYYIELGVRSNTETSHTGNQTEKSLVFTLKIYISPGMEKKSSPDEPGITDDDPGSGGVQEIRSGDDRELPGFNGFLLITAFALLSLVFKYRRRKELKKRYGVIS